MAISLPQDDGSPYDAWLRWETVGAGKKGADDNTGRQYARRLLVQYCEAGVRAVFPPNLRKVFRVHPSAAMTAATGYDAAPVDDDGDDADDGGDSREGDFTFRKSFAWPV